LTWDSTRRFSGGFLKDPLRLSAKDDFTEEPKSFSICHLTFVTHENIVRSMTNDKRQRTKDKGQRTKDKEQRTKDKGQMENGSLGWKESCGEFLRRLHL
jgi:hypothetical protein